MSEVRRHQRVTASGKKTTVRHHTRSGDRTARREDEAQAAREAWADRNAPHVSTLTPAEPGPQAQEWWAGDDEPPPGEFWDDEEKDDLDRLADRLRAERAARDATRTEWDQAELEARTALMFEDAQRRLEEYRAEEEATDG